MPDDAPRPPPLEGRRVLAAVKRCVALLDPEQRRRWAAVAPLGLFAAGLEAAGAALIFTLIRYISAPESLEGSRWLSLARRAVGADDPATFLVVFSVAVGTFYVLKNGVLLFQAYYTGRCAGLSVDALATRLLRGYLHAPYRDHLERSSADLVRNTKESVVGAYRSMLMSSVQAASEIALLVGLLSVLLIAAPGVTLVAVGGIGVLMLAFLRFTQNRMVRWGFESHQLHGRILAALTQSLGGVKEVKVLGREDYFLKTFARLRARLSRLMWRRGTLESAPRLTMETFFVLAVVLVILVYERGDQRGEVVPVLGLFAYTGFRMLPSLHRIVHHVNTIRFGSSAVEEIWADAVRYRDLAPPGAADTRLPFTDRLEIRDLRFAYDPARGPALDGVRLTVRRGESIGIVGATGAGKSTFVDLVLALLEPDAGAVEVDGVDVRSDPRGWRANVGYVPQSIYLVDDTLRRNIALGLDDEDIDEARVTAALEMAQLRAFVARLPGGLDTVVGERGVRLSGGERQRVAIARALYHQPEVLFFDEATSSLDNRTEQEIIRAVEGFRGEKTVLVVAHRLSTVRGCDRILMLEQGRVVAEGAYDRLVEESPEFRALAQAGPGR